MEREAGKGSFCLGNHLRLKFLLPENERADMGGWGGPGSVAVSATFVLPLNCLIVDVQTITYDMLDLSLLPPPTPRLSKVHLLLNYLQLSNHVWSFYLSSEGMRSFHGRGCIVHSLDLVACLILRCSVNSAEWIHGRREKLFHYSITLSLWSWICQLHWANSTNQSALPMLRSHKMLEQWGT